MNKILVFGITDNPGGMESVIMNYYKNIDKTKVQFDFLCNTEKVAYENEIIALGGNIFRITARSNNIKKYRKEMKGFFSANAKKYSAIWVNLCSLANIDYLKYAKKYGIKYRIIHSHNSENDTTFLRAILHKNNKRIIQKYATDFWACSDEAGKWFYSKEILDSHKYRIVNNAIDVEKYRFREECRKKYRKDLGLENKIVIGNVGRFHFQKNHEFLIEIFAELRKKYDNVQLVLVGQGELQNHIKDKVNKLGLNDFVTFLGVRNDIAGIMNAMDIFLFPSLFEGMPLVLIEAQASALPCVVSKDSIPEKVKMTDQLMFIPLEKEASYWADKISDIIDNLEISNRKNINIRGILECGYDIKTEVEKLEKFFGRK